jgi:hypothetical protein
MVLPGLINTPLVKMLADKNAGGDQEAFCKKRDAQVPTGVHSCRTIGGPLGSYM